MHSGYRISEYVAKLALYQAIEQYENWFEFFVEAYFCLGVFWSGVLFKISEPESVKDISEWSRSVKISHSVPLYLKPAQTVSPALVQLQ